MFRVFSDLFTLKLIKTGSERRSLIQVKLQSFHLFMRSNLDKSFCEMGIMLLENLN